MVAPGSPSRASTLSRHHLPPRSRRGRRASGVRPAGGPQRLPAPHGRRAVPGARPRPPEPRRRLRAAHRQRAVAARTAAGRSARAATSGSGAGTATATPRATTAASVDPARTGRLHILEVQRLIRMMPKVVICLVPGWAAGGGHSLHVVCDLTLASREHARFRQTDTDVASFDGGFGSRLPGPPGRPEVRPGDLLPRRHLHRGRRPPHGHGQRGGRPRRPGAGGPGVGPRGSWARARPPSAC